MSKQEFLAELRIALTGQVSAQIINDNMKYYEDYINMHIRQGESEAEIFATLGSPRLLAKSIIFASQNQAGDNQSEYGQSNYGQSDYNQSEYDQFGYGQSGQGQYQNKLSGFMKIRSGLVGIIRTITRGSNKVDADRVANTILTVLAFLVFFFVLGIIMRLFIGLLPIIIPIVVVLYLVKLFKS